MRHAAALSRHRRPRRRTSSRRSSATCSICARLEGGGDTLDAEEVLVDDLFRRVARPPSADAARAAASRCRPRRAPGTPHVWGDPDRLEQALQNVAANAHPPHAGWRTRHARAEPAGERVRITVTDTGPAFRPSTCRTSSIGSTRSDASRAGTPRAVGQRARPLDRPRDHRPPRRRDPGLERAGRRRGLHADPAVRGLARAATPPRRLTRTVG